MVVFNPYTMERNNENKNNSSSLIRVYHDIDL